MQFRSAFDSSALHTRATASGCLARGDRYCGHTGKCVIWRLCRHYGLARSRVSSRIAMASMTRSAASCKSLKRLVASAMGKGGIMNFVKSVAAPWHALRMKQSELERQCVVAKLFQDWWVRVHRGRTCPAVKAPQTAKVRLLVYRYCKCAPPSIYSHRHGRAFALRILGRLEYM